jgi:hypothetical protein
MIDQPEVTTPILTAIRRDMRDLAFGMSKVTTSVQAMQEQIRDMQARLNDVLALQVTKGDLDVVHFELDRLIKRLDAHEA